MGSPLLGGIYAKEPTALLTRIIARRLAVMSSTWEQLRDLTLPVVSYFSGFRMNRSAHGAAFRGAKIEEGLPFF